MSVIRRYPLFGVSVIRRFLRYSIIGKAVGTLRTVRYTVGVRYSECPLKEVPLYLVYNFAYIFHPRNVFWDGVMRVSATPESKI